MTSLLAQLSLSIFLTSAYKAVMATNLGPSTKSSRLTLQLVGGLVSGDEAILEPSTTSFWSCSASLLLSASQSLIGGPERYCLLPVLHHGRHTIHLRVLLCFTGFYGADGWPDCILGAFREVLVLVAPVCRWVESRFCIQVCISILLICGHLYFQWALTKQIFSNLLDAGIY